MSVCPSGSVRLSVCVSENWHHILQSYHKMSLTKVACYVFRVKNMHPGSPSVPWCSLGKAMLSYIITLLGKVKPSCVLILNITSVLHHLPSVSPKQLCALEHVGCTREADHS